MPIDLSFQHPNTVKIEFIDKDKSFYVIGSSIGGGAIEITNINGVLVKFSGLYDTLILKYPDKYGMIAKVSNILAENKINMGSIIVNRKENIASAIIELDGDVDEKIVEKIKKLKDMFECMILRAL